MGDTIRLGDLLVKKSGTNGTQNAPVGHAGGVLAGAIGLSMGTAIVSRVLKQLKVPKLKHKRHRR